MVCTRQNHDKEVRIGTKIRRIGDYRNNFGVIKIEPAEAEIVRYIYESFLEGATPADIARELTAQGISTPMNLSVWGTGTITVLTKIQAG